MSLSTAAIREVLHKALKETIKINSDRVIEIIKEYPRSIKENLGCLPIHTAIDNNHSLDIIRTLIDAYPESVHTPDNEGYMPIHNACRRGHSLETVTYLVDLYFYGLLEATSGDLLPIHLACGSDIENQSVIVYLANKCPRSLRVKNRFQNLPIHYACSHPKSGDIIPTLIEIYPESLLVGRYDGSLPIHLLCMVKPNIDLIRFIGKQCPECFKVKNNRDNLPIHYLLDRSRYSGIFAAVEVYPDCLLVSRNGSLPIHIACELKLPNDVIIYLASRCPQSLSIPNSNGDIPLHLVLNNYTLNNQESIVRAFVVLSPTVVHIKTLNKGGLTALGIARKQGGCVGIVYRILLNSSPNEILESPHRISYRELNWRVRKKLIFVQCKLVESDNDVDNQFLRTYKRLADTSVEESSISSILLRISSFI